ncbi:glycosyltransferase [Flagellimonas sp.]|uniref:glycosyltransferase n=1 Tax=Flagellimonas sp. TaxID=2058762 RepID=UPI003BAE1D9B
MNKILIIGHVWPEPTTTAAGKRMLQLINAFLEFGYDVTFGCVAARTAFSLDLETIGVRQVAFQLNHASFDDFIQELRPSVVVFDRFMTEEQFGWRVAEFAPEAVRVLNTEDLHSLRKFREECFKKGEEFKEGYWKNHPMTLREMASIYRSDLTLMISAFEMQLLTHEANVPENLLKYLPFMLNAPREEELASWPNFDQRRDFVCVGNGKHPPNVEAIKTLKKTIWPIVHQSLPEAKLCIYGAYLPQQVLEMHNPKEGFVVKRWVEDLDAALQSSRVLLAPIQFGAGTKGKLVDAMLNGTPSVTTPIGAEGIHGDLAWSGAICTDWQSFSQSAIELYTDTSKWQDAQNQGLEILTNQFPKSKIQSSLKKDLEEVQKHLEQHRSDNLIGRMLQQQGLAAAKYMGKWIEEKNKK